MAEEIKKDTSTKKELSFSPVFLISLLLLAVTVGLGVALVKEKAKRSDLEKQLNSAVAVRTKAERELRKLQSIKQEMEEELKKAQVKIEELSRELTVLQIAPAPAKNDSQTEFKSITQ